MSWTHLSDTTCKARKPHRCCVCESSIAKGEIQIVRRGIGDDGPCSIHMHRECELYSQRWDDMDWECGGEISRMEIIAKLALEHPQLTAEREAKIPYENP